MDSHGAPSPASGAPSPGRADAGPPIAGGQETPLAASEATILDALGDAIHVIDTDYRVIFANAALKRWGAALGMVPDPTGARLQNAYPLLAEDVFAEYEQVFATQQPMVTHETIIVDGVELTAETRKIPIIEDEAVVRIVTVIRDITEQKRQETGLRESEQRLRAFFESSADAIVVMDLDGIITDCNEAALRMYGYASRENVVGLNCIDFAAPEVRAELIEGIARTIRDGADRRAEHTFQRIDGTQFPTHVSANVIRDAAGVPVGLIANIRDITESKQAEEALRESEARLQSIFTSSPDAMLVYDTNGVIALANPAAERMYGYGSGAMTGLQIRRVIHPDYHPVYDEFVTQVLATGEFTTESVDVRTDGTSVAIEVRGSALTYRGEPHLISVIRDITDRKRAEDALRESEARMRAIFETSADAVFVVDPDGTLVLTNPATERMHGYEPGEMIGLKGPDFVHPDSLHVFETFVTELPHRGQIELEAVDIRKDGSSLDIEVRGSTFLYDGQELLLGLVRDVTDRKQAEEALRESEARMRAIFDTSADAMVVYSTEGSVVLANPAAERMYGYTPGAMVGVHSRAIVHPDHYHVFEAFIERLRDTGEFTAESADMRTDGSVFDVEVRGSLFQYQGESHFLAIVRDVTDRKRAEEALRLQRDLAMALSASSNLPEAAELLLQAALSLESIDAGGLYMVDSSDGSLYLAAHSGISTDFASLVSRYAPDAAETCEVMAGEPLYAPYAELSPGADLDGRRDAGVRSLAVIPISCRGRVIASLNVGSRADTEIPEATRKSLEAIAAQAGTVLARVDAEEAVREREQRLDLALHGGDLGTWDWDVRSDRVTIDTRWLAARGYLADGDGLQLRDIVELTHPDDAGPSGAALRAHLQGDTPFYEAEFRIRDRAGAWMWVLARGRVIERDDVGKPVRVCGTYVDISEQKRLEEHLLQSTKMEAIGRLAGGVAHDFNNILTAISGYTEFAIEQLERGSPAHADLEQVAKAAVKASALTRQLLAFSRQQVTEPRAVNLNAVVRDMEKMLRRVIGEDLDLSTSLAADIGCIWADLGQIEQVIMNLCVNARDAMPDGGRLTLRTRNSLMQPESADRPPGLQPGQYVCLDVIDTGTGMDAGTLARIYEPFFTTKRPGEGTGLGLATVYGIVQQVSGHIECRSQPGRGTQFTVYLPLHAEGGGDADGQGEPAHAAGGRERLLLVEDDEVVRDFAAEALRRQGYEVVEAAGPLEALAIAEGIGERLAGLVTDVIMPDMTGAELADTLTALYPQLAVLYVSGYAASAIEEENLIGPGTSFLSKPFSVRALADKVREVLDGRTGTTSEHGVGDT